MPRPINTATRIGQLRFILGLDACAFASLAGISHGLLRRVEAGFARLSNRTIERLAYVTGVDADWMLGEGKDMCPTRLDPDTGDQVGMTRGDFVAGPVKNLAGPLNPAHERMTSELLLKVRASFQAAERYGKLGAAYYVLERTLGEIIDRIASSREEAEKMRCTVISELKALR